uniref:Uncharacterized protein n=1 Tax=Candidatus Kentrum sp. UNK TaxID=2126344 RepID=A0A451AYL8_9GAMM|nr:MAG: Protein of unknown function (DUF4435) [Candidatus Kentron sp. UNK]VFK71124.1 MAG: Protein of unknown function (DUF4435) [Candidatus Kentron sp. UNK]
MPILKKLPISDTRAFGGQYLNTRLLYVESKDDGDDVTVFKQYWFEELGDVLKFIGASGCKQVIKRVERDRSRQIEAFGIVDRDSLISAGHNEWLLFFEEDDKTFRAEQPFGPYIHVLLRWEMENYLLHPDVIECYLRNSDGKPRRSREKVLHDLFSKLPPLIPVLAGKLLLRQFGLPESALPEKLGRKQTVMASTRGVRSILGKHLKEYSDTDQDPSVHLRGLMRKLRGFGKRHPKDSLERWLAWIRILDGKHLLNWIFRHAGIDIDHHDIRFHLAYITRAENKIDPELTNLIDKIKRGSTEENPT